MNRPYGIGIIGAGPVTQAIHLPVLASLGDEVRVTHIMDVDAHVAEAVAAQAGARASTSVEAVLSDPGVHIVVVCSPHQFHAEQVTAAWEAGKQAVMCEKPLATTVEEAQRLANLATARGALLVVGAMHVYDPAYRAARDYLVGRPPDLVRSVIYLPTNDQFIGLSTELVSTAAPPRGPVEGSPAAQRAASVRGGVLGLAIHNVPLVRELVPSVGRVAAAEILVPWGYSLSLASGDQSAQLIGMMPGQWGPSWTLTAWSSEYELHVEFPPSYVLAGSALATLTTASGTMSWRYSENGYQAEWRHLLDAVSGEAELPIPTQDAVDDLLYALEIAEGAAELVGREG